MAIATYQDLCIDAVDAAAMQLFWAETLGLEPVPDDGGTLDLVGPTPQHRVWINRVPEPVTVKQRVHLDVHAGSVDEVLALGATPGDLESFRWKRAQGPRGRRALCLRARRGARLQALRGRASTARDPHEIAAWWAEVLGVDRPGQRRGRDAVLWIDDVPGMPFESLVFQTVPEPKTVKNRIHWDVESRDVQALLDRGATLLRRPDDDIDWHVLADPEGNEFCACVRASEVTERRE